MLITGAVSGGINGLFGSGGGLVAVPCLERSGFEVRQAHACAIALTCTFSVISCAGYSFYGHLDFITALKYIPGGAVGAIIGAFAMRHIQPLLLKRIFGIVMIYSGVRLLL